MQEDYTYVILADDDEDDRLFFTEAFDELKIRTRVDTYKDGVELMDALHSPELPLPNIIFLDLNMPKKSGFECLVDLKKDKKFDSIAIAIYSTSASEEDIENTFVNGANIYIKKPNNFNDLKKVLTEIVTTNWQYQTNGLNRDTFLLRL
ncbi:MAG: response regulator [Aquaticitalea sp.]